MNHSQKSDADHKQAAQPQLEQGLDLDPLEKKIRESFEALGYGQLSSVSCDAEGDEVRLSGVLKSFYLKQVAQSVAVRVPGVRIVKNEIEVE